MRGVFAVEDWIKIAGGLLFGLLVLIIVCVFVMNAMSSDCWKGVTGSFDASLTDVSNMKLPLGNQDEFKVKLNLNGNFLEGIYFTTSRFKCNIACEASRLSSSDVGKCKDECQKSCDARACIIVVPSKLKMHPVDSNYLVSRNKIRIYNGGDYKFTFSANILSKVDAEKNVVLKPGYSEKCLVFSRNTDKDGKGYNVEARATEAGCK